MDCTVAEHLIPRDKCLHSVQWSETVDTNMKGNLDTEGHPLRYSNFRGYFPSYKSRASRVSLTAFDSDALAIRVSGQPPSQLSL